jgi:hypothetical protein
MKSTLKEFVKSRFGMKVNEVARWSGFSSSSLRAYWNSEDLSDRKKLITACHGAHQLRSGNIQTPEELFLFLVNNGFERTEYKDKDIIFFSRTFTCKEVPALFIEYQDLPEDERPGTVVLEISEDAKLLQYCIDSNDYETINTKEEMFRASVVLRLFRLVV